MNSARRPFALLAFALACAGGALAQAAAVTNLITDPANASKIARANPITYVTPDDPPFLIVHGDQDPLVPHHQSELLFAALENAGVHVRLNTVKGGGHGAGLGGPELEKIRRDFFEHHLQDKNNDAAKWPAVMRSSTDAIAAPVGGPKRTRKASASK